MQFHQVQIGRERFVVDVEQVAEVLPLICWDDLIDAPPGVVGTLDYHDQTVPLLDLALILTGHKTPVQMSARILVIKCPRADRRKNRDQAVAIGLLVERLSPSVEYDAATFAPPVRLLGSTDQLGEVRMDSEGTVQRLDPFQLLPRLVGRTRSPMAAAYA